MGKGEKKMFEMRRAAKMLREEQGWEHFQEGEYRGARLTMCSVMLQGEVEYPEKDRNQVALIRAVLENRITRRIHRGKFPALVQRVQQSFM
jgi:hypothetical protein